MRRRAIAILLLLGALAFPSGALASGDNTAVAVNTTDGSTLFRFTFDIKRAADGVVDNGNAAVAVSSCNDCETVAIAIQLVLVTGDPTTVTPENVAIALNENCNLCQTMALAYQVVVGTDGEVHFTADGERELHEIQKELADLEQSDLPLDELKARADALVARLKQVVANDLVASGNSGDAHDHEAGTTAATTTEPTTTGATTTEPTTSAGTTTEPATTLTDTTATDTATTPADTSPTTDATTTTQ